MNSPNPHPRAPGKLAAGGVVLFLGALGLLLCLLFQFLCLVRRGQVAFQPRPLASELRDVGFACLASGTVQPPIEELTDSELQEIAEILGRLIGAYERGDFDSFLALRHADLEYAGRVRRSRVVELRTLCAELGAAPKDLHGDWIELLRAYWTAYYRVPPVARFLPESTRFGLHHEELGARALEAWEEEFVALCAAHPGPRIDHRLAAPHRSSLEQVATSAGALRWFDLELAFEAHDGGAGLLVARFVWDDPLKEWFLHRATTVLDEEVRDDRRHLVL